ncbi:MAG TPA: aromatic amino acid lyase [Acidimicrobiales bacterium]|nr:aromatic amino acid lyase [Acidimicrobiales bacterium]
MRPSGAPLVLDGSGLGVGELVEAAREGRPLAYSDAARRRIAADHRALESALLAGEAVYGLTTGLGSRVTEAVGVVPASELGARTVRGRAHAVGPPLPAEVVRGALAARCGSIAHGGSGISPTVAELLLEMCNNGVHPLVPSTGSVGASDLCQMAHVGLVVIGEGSAEVEGAMLPGAVALGRAGLAPATLAGRDGLALCSSSAVTAALAALGLHDARAVLGEVELAAACSFEGFRANTNVLSAAVVAARPAPGQQESAARLVALLAGSALFGAEAPRRLQDPISFRCLPQVHGAFRAAAQLLEDALLAELNGTADNPLVTGEDPGGALPGGAEVVPTGNFHTAALGLGLEVTALALARVVGLSVRRVQRLLSAATSGLPPRLVAGGADRSGFGPLLKVAHALLADVAHLATPVPVIAPAESEAEDDASPAPWAARRLREMIPLARRVAAIEALVACQAVDLAAPSSIAAAPRRLLEAVRRRVPPLGDDRPLSSDVEAAAVLLAAISAELANELAGFREGSP